MSYVFLDTRSRQFRFVEDIDELTEGQVKELQQVDAQLFELGKEWVPKMKLTWEPKE